MQRTHASKARGKLEQTRKWFLSFLINIKGHPECHIYIFSFRRIYGKGKKGTNSCLGWSWKKEWHLSSKLSKNQILPSSQSPLTTSHAKSLLSLMCNLWAYPQPRTHSPLRQCRDNDYWGYIMEVWNPKQGSSRFIWLPLSKGCFWLGNHFLNDERISMHITPQISRNCYKFPSIRTATHFQIVQEKKCLLLKSTYLSSQVGLGKPTKR